MNRHSPHPVRWLRLLVVIVVAASWSVQDGSSAAALTVPVLPSVPPTQAEQRTAVLGAMVEAEIGSVLVTGTATFYCLPPRWTRCTKGHPAGSMVAAAGSELRTPGWRGSWVTVSRGNRSVRVQLVDWCACKGVRVIDLYGAAFRKLADPSLGVIDVVLEYGGPQMTLPPTDQP